MIQVPDNFPSYTSYSPKTLIMQVDTLKACVRELQQEIAALKTTQVPAAAKTKKDATNA
jgi:hypothetical protein